MNPKELEALRRQWEATSIEKEYLENRRYFTGPTANAPAGYDHSRMLDFTAQENSAAHDRYLEAMKAYWQAP